MTSQVPKNRTEVKNMDGKSHRKGGWEGKEEQYKWEDMIVNLFLNMVQNCEF